MIRNMGLALIVLLACSTIASAQSPQLNLPWAQLTDQPSTHSPSFNADTALLLTDGTVLCEDFYSKRWFRLTPDAYGDYVNGKWSQVASANYDRDDFVSAVLADGRVFVAGGEYSTLGGGDTTKVEIYDPWVNTWTIQASPQGWTNIGDSPSVVLPNGDVLIGEGPPDGSEHLAEFSPKTGKWTALASRRTANSETGFTMIYNGNVISPDCDGSPDTDLYIPSLNKWIDGGNVPKVLAAIASTKFVKEMGPALLLPTGLVLATGATGNTDFYWPGTSVTSAGSWLAGPTMPTNSQGAQLGIEDGPGCVLPSGNVLLCTSPAPVNGHKDFENGVVFFELDPLHSNYQLLADPGTNTSQSASEDYRMLLLPTGQVLVTAGYANARNGAGSSPVVVYTSAGSPDPSWAPTITRVEPFLAVGTTYSISGTQFNGLTNGAAYGDDAQMATNYPLVRITNFLTGHVFYCRTHDHSTMGVQTASSTVSTNFDVPGNIETGLAVIEVVANGIASVSQGVYIVSGADVTPDFKVTKSSLTYSSSTRTYNGTITLLNTSHSTLVTPLSLLFDGLSPNVTLKNAVGTLDAAPYIRFDTQGHSIPPGNHLTLPVQFKASSASAVSYTNQLFTGW